jgi:hypothetical protein
MGQREGTPPIGYLGELFWEGGGDWRKRDRTGEEGRERKHREAILRERGTGN